MDCIVPSCNSRRDVQRHNFPRNTALGQQWLKNINSPALQKLSYQDILRKQLRVCYKHFERGSWIVTVKKPRLKDTAVPTLFLGEPATDEYFKEQGIDASIEETQENCEPNPKPSEISPPTKYERSPCTTPVRRSSLNSPLQTCELIEAEGVKTKKKQRSSRTSKVWKLIEKEMKNVRLAPKGKRILNDTLKLRNYLAKKSRQLKR